MHAEGAKWCQGVARGLSGCNSSALEAMHLVRVRVRFRARLRARVSPSRRCTSSPPRMKMSLGVESKLAQAMASWLSGGCSQQQTMPQAAPGSGQPRPICRLGVSGRL